MNKLFVMIALSLCIVNAQRPSRQDQDSGSFDFNKCLATLQDLQVYLVPLVQEVYMENPNGYLQNLRLMYNQFRRIAGNCGVTLPPASGPGNPLQCQKDMNILTALFTELNGQSQKEISEKNLISIITIYMSLANNVPKALQDCGVRRA